MTSIFTRFTELDPALLERQVESDVGSPVFDAFSLLDQQRMAQQAATALGGTLTNAALLDPSLALRELDALADASGGGGVDEFGLQLGGLNLQLDGQDLTLGA